MLYYVMVSDNGIPNGFILIHRNCLQQASEVQRFEVLPRILWNLLFPQII